MTQPGFASILAMERFRILQPYFEEAVSLVSLVNDGGPSERTLRRWVERYATKGISGLERQRRSDVGQRRTIVPELEALVRTLAAKQRRPTLTTLHRQVCGHASTLGVASPSYSVVTDIVRKVSPAAMALAAGCVSEYRDHHELVYRREAERANEIWQADHTLLDIVLLDSKGHEARPWLSIVIDDYSRAIAGYFLTFAAPSAMNTALALRQAIWRKENPRWIICGIPEMLYVDNGSDFTSDHLHQASVALKMPLVHSFPGRPRGRGRVERMFRTINDMFLADLPGRVIEGKMVSKPEWTFERFTQGFEVFLHETYHQRPHGSTGEAPLARWQASGFLPNLPETCQELDMLLLRVTRLRKVSRDGIHFGGHRYTEPTLAAFIGEAVEVLYDPRDLAEIHVYHDGMFVCRAVAPNHGDAPSLADIQQARTTTRRQHRKETAQASAHRAPKCQSGLKLYAHDD